MSDFSNLDDDSVGILVAAIIERACKDYKRLLKRNKPIGSNAHTNIDELENFFRSEWFELLCPVITGEELIKYLKNEVKRHENSKAHKS